MMFLNDMTSSFEKERKKEKAEKGEMYGGNIGQEKESTFFFFPSSVV